MDKKYVKKSLCSVVALSFKEATTAPDAENVMFIYVAGKKWRKVWNCDLKFIDGAASAHSQELNTEEMWNRNRSHVTHLFWHFLTFRERSTETLRNSWTQKLNSTKNNERRAILPVRGPFL